MLARVIRHLRFRLGYQLPLWISELSPSVEVRYLLRSPFTRALTIGAAPKDFHPRHVMFKATRMLGIRQRRGWWTGPSICWGDPPFPSAPPHALNVSCQSIDKSIVERTFAEVFGYGYAVDPLTCAGPMVRKSEINATHDGRVEVGPLEAAVPGFVYQRLIDNRVSDTETEEIRVPVILRQIPFVYLKRRSVEARFGNSLASATVAAVADILTEGEQALIISFCDRMGLDFAELDVLRDRNDRRIYIVDANNTPSGPPKGLPYSAGVKSVRAIARLLATSWLRAG